MTLRVTLEIVPFGDEDNKREIATINISNVGEVENLGFGHSICNYNYHCSVPMAETREDRGTGTIYNHDRRDGALELVQRVLTSIESL